MNRHDFLVLYFCVANLSWRIFTLEEIFAGKMFAVIFICGNLFLRIAGKIAKIEKIRSRKNCVSHSNIFLLFVHYELFNMDKIIIACDVSTGLILFGTVANCVDQPKKF